MKNVSTRILVNTFDAARSYAPIYVELVSHPDVLEVSVVGREHPIWGEHPMVYVILHTESAERWAGKHPEFSSALKAYARERLPGFAAPGWVVVVEELPVRPALLTHPSVFKHGSSNNHARKRRLDKS
jgi:acyl-coenzyme A synthetase/AMP-(fatty) acid ligase